LQDRQEWFNTLCKKLCSTFTGLQVKANIENMKHAAASWEYLQTRT
jgi:hypothetical protein